MRRARALVFGVAVVAFSAATVGAAPITPTFTSFGTLAEATFGSPTDSIPKHAVAITTKSGITLGLTAHQRYVGADLANDGAGTFTAFTGVSTVSPSPADPYATWNFGFYVGGTAVGDYNYKLFYDFDPGVDTQEGIHGVLGPAGLQQGFPSQGSWNLGMNFLASSATPGVFPPSGVFNPNVAGEYTFALVAYDQAGEFARSAIRVNVVPEPTTLMLLGLGLAAAGRKLRRR